jgi:hypothetical protein
MLVVVGYFSLRQNYVSVWDKIIISECINHYLWYSQPMKIIENLVSFSPRCDRPICNHWFWLQYALMQPTLSVSLSYYLFTTNNCLLHVPSIATNTNSMQLLCITSKNCSLHYNINCCHQQLLVACDLCHHQHEYVAIYIYYIED